VDRRAETRFSISSQVKVTLLSSLDRQIECRMIDISGTGMRFIAGEALLNDEVVAVDFEDHLAVATVRNCQAYGDKYSIGTSRIHSLPKDQLPAGQPKYQQIRALLEEKGWSVEIETLDPAQLQRVPEPVAPATPVSLAPETESPAVAEAVKPAEVEPEPLAQALPNPLPPPPVENSEPSTPPPPASIPSARPWRGRIVIAAGLALAIATVSYLLHLMHEAPVYSAPAAASAPSSVPSSVPAAPPAPQPSVAQVAPPTPEPTSTPDPQPTSQAGLHHARFTVLERAWVSVTADGKPAIAKVLDPGETPEVEFSKIAYVHLGNFHAVQINLDGVDVQAHTGGGALRLIELSPSGARTLPWSNGDPAPEN
jgi:hypothetical protein